MIEPTSDNCVLVTMPIQCYKAIMRELQESGARVLYQHILSSTAPVVGFQVYTSDSIETILSRDENDATPEQINDALAKFTGADIPYNDDLDERMLDWIEGVIS